METRRNKKTEEMAGTPKESKQHGYFLRSVVSKIGNFVGANNTESKKVNPEFRSKPKADMQGFSSDEDNSLNPDDDFEHLTSDEVIPQADPKLEALFLSQTRSCSMKPSVSISAQIIDEVVNEAVICVEKKLKNKEKEDTDATPSTDARHEMVLLGEKTPDDTWSNRLKHFATNVCSGLFV